MAKKYKAYDTLDKGISLEKQQEALQEQREGIFKKLDDAIKSGKDLSPQQVQLYTEKFRQLDRAEDTLVSTQGTLKNVALTTAQNNIKRIAELQQGYDAAIADPRAGMFTFVGAVIGNIHTAVEKQLHDLNWGASPDTAYPRRHGAHNSRRTQKRAAQALEKVTGNKVRKGFGL